MAADRDYQLEAKERDGAVTVALRGRVTVNNAQDLLNEIAAACRPAPAICHSICRG